VTLFEGSSTLLPLLGGRDGDDEQRSASEVTFLAAAGAKRSRVVIPAN
jgi:hypothetical protein